MSMNKKHEYRLVVEHIRFMIISLTGDLETVALKSNALLDSDLASWHHKLVVGGHEYHTEGRDHQRQQ